MLTAAFAAAGLFASPRDAAAQCPTVGTGPVLTDGAGFTWDVFGDGSISNGSIDAYDDAFYITVNGLALPAATATASELSGRQVVVPTVTLAGLRVTRRIYVPNATGQGWARFFDSFDNPSTAAITVTVRIQNNAGSDSGTVITGSFSGDTAFDRADRWVTSDDSDNSGDPATGYNFWGLGAAVTPSNTSTTVFDCAATNGYLVDFSLTVPAGQTRSILYFGSQATLRSSVLATVRAIDAGGAVYTAGLSAADLATVVNWRFCDDVDHDGDGQSCVAGDCDDGNVNIRTGIAERCDGIDNNCNGMSDEGLGVGESCTAGVGACLRTGVRACAAGVAACSAVAGAPSAELCGDMIDNDCNGMVDEGFDVGMSCSAGVGGCRRTGMRVCATDRMSTVCNASAGTGVSETCDGVDNDCNGTVDDGYNVGMPCSAGMGSCRADGALVCNAAGDGTRCSATATTPGTELCGDMIDNDCDGMVDEGFDVGAACEAGAGACRQTGVRVCATDRMSTTCTAMAREPMAESCDGVDNDCNGTVDDGMSLCTGRSDGPTCLATTDGSFCGCAADLDCGGAMSGRICDASTHRCVDGCGVGMGRNTCPSGQFCSSDTAARTGVCTMGCNFDAQCAGMTGRTRCLAGGGDGGASVCVSCLSDGDCAMRTDNRTLCIGADHTCAQCSPTSMSRCTPSGVGAACLTTGLCGCTSDNDCAANRQCNMVMNQCEPRPVVDAGRDVGTAQDAAQDVVTTDTATQPDAGDAFDTGPGIVATSTSGCGCRTTGSTGTTPAGLALGAVAVCLARRRRRAAR